MHMHLEVSPLPRMRNIEKPQRRKRGEGREAGKKDEYSHELGGQKGVRVQSQITPPAPTPVSSIKIQRSGGHLPGPYVTRRRHDVVAGRWRRQSLAGACRASIRLCSALLRPAPQRTLVITQSASVAGRKCAERAASMGKHATLSR